MKIQKLSRMLLAFGLLFVFGGFINHYYLITAGPNGSVFGEWIDQNYANISWELLSLFITVRVIDEIYGRKEKRAFLEKVYVDSRSGVNDVAIRAIEELRHQGLLTDGSLNRKHFSRGNLIGANFSNAHLQDSVFYATKLNGAHFNSAFLERSLFTGANCENAIFNDAKLEDCVFESVNLKGASFQNADIWGARFFRADFTGVKFLTDSQLVCAWSLGTATMGDGKKYDGRFRLKGDISEAKLFSVDIDDIEAMATFYRIELSEYISGQEWANTELKKLMAMVKEKDRKQEENE